MIKEINGKAVSADGKTYYYIALCLKTGEYIRIKNAGCDAAAMDIACTEFCVDYDGNAFYKVKVFFQGTSSELNLNMIPKKYHKYFKER